MKKADILLVDDEVVFTTNMSRLLTSRGYQVTTVKDGAEAIAALKQKPFDVMVLDLKMPVMDGITTLGEGGSRKSLGSNRTLRPMAPPLPAPGGGPP